ncbi:MAG: hypothetical protein HRF50_04455 [Phycisphaerae bacterium]
MADDLADSIRTNAQAPRKVEGDEATVEQHSLPDQIAADRYLASKAAAKKTTLGIQFRKIVPPGAT